MSGLPVAEHVAAAAGAFAYRQQVFMAPPWSDIFGRDDERRQDLAEAERTYETMVEVCTELGYELVTLPRDDVASRVEFVIDLIPART